MNSDTKISSPLMGEDKGGGVKKKRILNLARKMRREPTDAERKLWRIIRNKQVAGCKFRRQQPIGHYIVDFVCFEKNLILEIDGGQHAEAENLKYDKRRTEFLEGNGFKVLRFWNVDILKNSEGVYLTILKELNN